MAQCTSHISYTRILILIALQHRGDYNIITTSITITWGYQLGIFLINFHVFLKLSFASAYFSFFISQGSVVAMQVFCFLQCLVLTLKALYFFSSSLSCFVLDLLVSCSLLCPFLRLQSDGGITFSQLGSNLEWQNLLVDAIEEGHSFSPGCETSHVTTDTLSWIQVVIFHP